jgi:plasmid stabilization system protein ParE
MIFYRVKAGEIRILRIIHSSRDARMAFGEE